MTKIKMVVKCPCGQEHVWWHDCPIPLRERDPGAAYSVPEPEVGSIYDRLGNVTWEDQQ